VDASANNQVTHAAERLTRSVTILWLWLPREIRLTRKLGPGGRAAADLGRCGGEGWGVAGLSGE